jgi:glycosyltransferase involved in cell wall biosynthesis
MTEIRTGNSTMLAPAARSPRVALVCDFLEENWPSMDLVADMLFEHLERQHAGDFSVTRLRPAMQKRLGRLPFDSSLLRNADRFASRFIDYPRWLRRRARDFDLFHVVDHSYAQLVHYLPPERTIVTCHDLDTFRCLLDPEREPRPLWFRAMTARILSGLKTAAFLITGSSVVRDEIIRHRLSPPERVKVIANGVHSSCSPIPEIRADAELERLVPADSGAAIWLLSVGSTMARKRLDVLLRVFAGLRRQSPEVRLLRVGGRLTPPQLQLARELGVEDALVELGTVDRAILAAAYRRAHLLLHTAEAEGFGLPLIEAMASGCPVVASSIPVLREVGGAAATYCPVGDVDAWKTAVLSLLPSRSGQDVYQLARERAIAHAAAFSWVETARQTACVYEHLLCRKSALGVSGQLTMNYKKEGGYE